MAAPYEVTERLYLDADKQRVVSEGDPAAAWLYAIPGAVVPLDEAERYGLHERAAALRASKSGAAEQFTSASSADTDEPQPSTEAYRAPKVPAEDKAVRGSKEQRG